jgi:hypothetical protein
MTLKKMIDADKICVSLRFLRRPRHLHPCFHQMEWSYE